MSSQSQQFLSPLGRLVQGNPLEKQTKDQQGNLLTIKSGPQAGQPTQKFFGAVAFSKTECPEFAAFYALMVAEARRSFPQLFDAAGNCTHPRFSWKFVDGDSTVVDEGGKRPCDKEGFPGHWVVRFQSSFPPKVFYKGRYAPQDMVTDPSLLRRGWFVRISGTVEGNGNAQKPGLYVNLSMVEIVAQGPEITSGPDGASVFGAAPVAALPAGATALPSVGMPQAQPPMPGALPQPSMPGLPGAQPQAPTMPGAQPSMPGLPGAMPPAAALPVQPNPAFAAGPGAMLAPPSPPIMMPPPPPPAGPQLTPAGAATGFSYAQFVAAGWNDAALRQSGYIA